MKKFTVVAFAGGFAVFRAKAQPGIKLRSYSFDDYVSHLNPFSAGWRELPAS
jgi:hypothetical protein